MTQTQKQLETNIEELRASFGGSNARETPASDSLQAVIFGIYDRLADHGHCAVDVVLAPAKPDGSPDWENTDPANVSSLPADEWPEDLNEEKRACVIVSDIDGCEADSTFIVIVDAETRIPAMAQIHGAEIDRTVADSIIGRDLGNRPAVPPPSRLAESLAKLTAEFAAKPTAANDNEPGIDERLLPYGSAFGGEIRGKTLFGATVDGVQGQIVFDETGQAWFHYRGRAGAAAKRVALPQKQDDSLNFINPAQWRGLPIPSRQWYIDGLIPMRQVTILNGDGGVGKSLLALQIAAAGAMSHDTLGMAPWAGRTLYIGAEDEAEEFWRRLADIAKFYGRDIDYLFMLRLLSLADQDALLATPDTKGNMQHSMLYAKIVEFAAEFRPRLIVFDTAADLFGGDEIKRGQVRQFIAMLRQLAIGLDCAVILLAHPSVQGIQSGTGSSGSTAWNNSVRSRLYLTRPEGKDADPDLRILKTMKANYGTTGGEIKFRWKDGVFVLDDGRPAAVSMMVAARVERIYLETLTKLLGQGQKLSPSPSATFAPKVISGHPDASGISKKELAAAQQRLLDAGRLRIVEEGPPSRRTKYLAVVDEQASD